MQESLSNSLLTQMDAKQASEAELREAFCRDIDAYSFEMQPQVNLKMILDNKYVIFFERFQLDLGFNLFNPCGMSAHQAVMLFPVLHVL